MGFPDDSERFGPEKALMLAGYLLESGGSVTILCVAEFSQNSTLGIFYGKVGFCLNLMGHTSKLLICECRGGFWSSVCFLYCDVSLRRGMSLSICVAFIG